jgi:hypothetical protein
MALNSVTCGNCRTENPSDADFCRECGQPLTGSAEEGLRESLDAQDHGSLIGAEDTPGLGVGGLGLIGGAGGVGATLLPGDLDRDDVPRD